MIESRIAIAGGGISGLKSALELDKIGLKSTIIEPLSSYPEEEINPITYSTPLIFESIVEEYGIIPDQDAHIEQFESTFLTQRRRAFTLLLNAYIHLFNDYLYAPSIYDIRTKLRSDAEKSTNIAFIDGKVTDVMMDGNKVSGIEIDKSHELATDLVIDASGRNGIVSKKVAEINPLLVNEKKDNQPTTIVGSYVSIAPEVISKYMSKSKHTMYSEVLPNNLEFIFIPAGPKTGTNGDISVDNRYLLLIEGDREKIDEAYKNTPGKSATKRFEVIKNFVNDTRWEPIIQLSTNPHETIYYKFNEALLRELYADNAVLVGDARMNVSPISGAGLAFLNNDIKYLVRAVKKNPTDMHSATELYRKSIRIPSLLKWLYSKNKYANSLSAKVTNGSNA